MDRPWDLMIDRFKKLGAKVIQENVVHANQPAVRLHVETQGVAAEFILLSTSRNDYMLAVQSSPSNLGNATHQADIERFFASFKIPSSDQ